MLDWYARFSAELITVPFRCTSIVGNERLQDAFRLVGANVPPNKATDAAGAAVVHDPSNEHAVPAAALLPVLVGQVGGSFSKAAEGSLIQSGEFMG